MGAYAESKRGGYTLLTGATGLVGSMLVRDLLRQGTQVVVLTRPTRKQSAADRIDSMLRFWDNEQRASLSRPICLVGDVRCPDLGLSRYDQRWLRHHCARVVHCAAIVKFTSGDGQSELWKTNLDGTRRTLQLCRQIGVREFHYVSTAYVCGRRQGVIYESELEMGQSFRNDYERSKYEAEILIRSDTFIDPPTIYRPAVISGDSQTGYTNSFHGIYVYLRLLYSLMMNTPLDRGGRRFAPLRIDLDGDERRNVVPLDWLSAVLCRLIETPLARGLTFHLAPRVPITARDFFDAVYRYFDGYGYDFCGKGHQLAGNLSRFEEAFLEYRTPYEDYECTDPTFDRLNLDRFAGGLPCPRIDQRVMGRYLDFAHRTAWGKRSVPNSTQSVSCRAALNAA